MTKISDSETKTKITPEAGRILVVDDEEIVHVTLKRLLEREGYAIDSAYSGIEALGKIDTDYDLLILDIRMPDLDGIEVLREIRRRELAIEVIILTGYANMESAMQAVNYGARGYLMKPIENIPQFKNQIHEAIHISQLARKNRQFYDAIISDQSPTIRKEKREIFQRLMEVIRDAVVFLDFDGNVTFANVNFAQMLGESYQNLLGARFESYVAEGDQDQLVEVFTRLSSGQVAISIPAQLKTNYGSLLSVIISSSPIYYKKEYRGIVMVISDITQVNRVREKVELLANLVENAQHDMMLIVNSEGQIMECNSLTRKSFGYSRSGILGMNMSALFKSEADWGWERILDSVKHDSNWRGEVLATSLDGKEFPVEITVSRRGKVDSSAQIICFMRDLTERKRAEAERAEALANAARIEQQEQELRRLRQLSASPQTAVTAKMLGIAPLHEYIRDTFDQLVRQYGDLMDLAMEKRAYKVDHNISEGLCSIAEQVGLVKGGPRDVVEVYSSALQAKTKAATARKAQAYVEEGRIMALELMGYLVSYYRRYSPGSGRATASAAPEGKGDGKTNRGEDHD